MRFFKAGLAIFPDIYTQTKAALGQPNPRADEPFPELGDFDDGEFAYLALGDHHCEGEFTSLIVQFLTLPNVFEITEHEYRTAMPQPEIEP